MPPETPPTPAELRFLDASRTAVLSTRSPEGGARLVPICFVLAPGPGPTLYSPLDEKPKRVANPHDLERVKDILADPEVDLLVDRWSEDWTRLAWLRLRGRASLLEPGGNDPEGGANHELVVAALRAKYPQYATHRLEERPVIRVELTAARTWAADPAALTRPLAGGNASSSSPRGSRPR